MHGQAEITITKMIYVMLIERNQNFNMSSGRINDFRGKIAHIYVMMYPFRAIAAHITDYTVISRNR